MAWAMGMTEDKAMTTATAWMNDVDVDNDLDEQQAEYYRAYRALRAKANAARIEFEESMQGMAEPGHKLVFNYRFGKLSLAQVKGEYNQAPSKPKANRPSLSEFLAKQANGGHSR